jgi:hypothetical protein
MKRIAGLIARWLMRCLFWGGIALSLSCVLLWIRSYYIPDDLSVCLSGSDTLYCAEFFSSKGKLGMSWQLQEDTGRHHRSQIRYTQCSDDPLKTIFSNYDAGENMGFAYWVFEIPGIGIVERRMVVPIWVIAFVFAALPIGAKLAATIRRRSLKRRGFEVEIANKSSPSSDVVQKGEDRSFKQMQ